MPVVDTSIVARLEEARIAAAFAEIAPDAVRLAGGVLSRAAPGSWLNALVGAGLAGPVTDADIAAVIEYHSSKGIEPRVEICTLADESLVAAAGRAGFVVRGFDNVLFRTISQGQEFTAPSPAPPELLIETVDPTDAARVHEFAVAQTSGFALPGEEVPERAILDAERAARYSRSISFVARLPREAGRTVVAAGAMELFGELIALYGLSVAEAFRRRGIQQAITAHRLRIGAQRGAKFATIGSRPGGRTERNVRRMGFELAYTKVCVGRPGPGLIPTRE